MHHEEEVKKRLYKNLLATLVVVGTIVSGLSFFTPAIGSFFVYISKIGKPALKEDVSAPTPPYFYSAPKNTNQKQLTLKGFSEPGSKVLLYVNGPEVSSVIADSSGSFILEIDSLIEGKNIIYAKAEDAYQNQSEKSQILEIIYDTKKPEITVTGPKDESTVRNLNQRVLVSGTVDEKCEVKINEKLAIFKPDNSFELLLGVTEGDVDIKIEATDLAGNKSEKTLKIKYVKSGI